MNKELFFAKKRDDRFYPTDALSRLIAAIANCRSFDRQSLDLIQQLGYTVNVIDMKEAA